MNAKILFLLIVLFVSGYQNLSSQNLIPVGKGWASNSVNTTIFRKNSIASVGNVQFIAYYDQQGFVVLGKRNWNEQKWILKRTQYKGTVRDAHNSISIMADGNGYLHLSWDHHGHPLHYARSIAPYSLEMGDMCPMTGLNENHITYPEFFRMPDGNLIFMYRDGSSGRGNLVMNSYDLKTGKWTQIQRNLIDGEDKRNAYWQACVDNKGTIHVSWVWRESWLVETNHDLCYAKSSDGGKTWQNSNGEVYSLPININNAEYACYISQESELINQTSMTTDNEGNPYIATYWRNEDSTIPQYHVVYNDGKQWQTIDMNFRKTPFSLKGGGTKNIPISRPQLVAKHTKKKTSLYMLFRDEERDSKVSLVICENKDNGNWKIKDLTDFSVNSWEPSYDTELWRNKDKLHVFVQNAVQIDGEGKTDVPPQNVYVLELTEKDLKQLSK